jgi:hypothetical protein
VVEPVVGVVEEGATAELPGVTILNQREPLLVLDISSRTSPTQYHYSRSQQLPPLASIGLIYRAPLLPGDRFTSKEEDQEHIVNDRSTGTCSQ